MLRSELKNELDQNHMDAVILSYADSNHYLAGGLDALGNYHLLTDRQGKTMTYNSLREAELVLAELGATQATFDMETAYDEMIGNVSDGHCRFVMPLNKETL
ncbi:MULTISPECIES: DUF6482 family protein [Pseudoalteromonas]|uniref:Uncharacterized protein n=2 Tax=Pseudoalteromonas rubra TaxID=43658 RepID=A0A0L0ENT8_9GAMM|nr:MULTISPECIES: DUF6482 family protein [Pseudoalteromonas]KNC66147.1 hypothetical protein AC626_18720 [Pseudoalteromonas rubra]MCG7563666.1 DUF6482 family protein [Pseudoalteromonas sp. McH1-42]MDK1313835.1 DUF6482 family protein [Pseudoalteromonas sp. R96]MEC4090285.1 DUF6482 family protein [Pseudoalteromonas rubra]QPB85008.1 hypothetical protein CWC22_019260 [Pseudoalteromonas rubra]